MHTNDISTVRDGASPFDAIRRVTPEGREYWSARELMPLLGYEKWERFVDAIDRAKISAHNAGYQVTDHFPGAGKMIEAGKGAQRTVVDFHLSRFACYLIALNGDPRKPEIAAAQTYFVIRTREAETRPAVDVSEVSRRDLALAIIDAEDRADREAAARIEAEAHARELEAPASAWKHMAAAAGDYAVGDAAKILSRDPAISIGRDRLFAFMAAEGWVYRSGRRRSWTAYQTQVDNGRLVEKMGKPFLNERTGETELPAPTIRITAKGLADLHKRLGGTDPLSTVAVAA